MFTSNVIPRQVGSTSTILNAAIAYGATLIVHNNQMRRALFDRYPVLQSTDEVNIVTLQEVSLGVLQGTDRPVFVDPACLMTVQARSAIEDHILSVNAENTETGSIIIED